MTQQFTNIDITGVTDDELRSMYLAVALSTIKHPASLDMFDQLTAEGSEFSMGDALLCALVNDRINDAIQEDLERLTMEKEKQNDPI